VPFGGPPGHCQIARGCIAATGSPQHPIRPSQSPLHCRPEIGRRSHRGRARAHGSNQRGRLAPMRISYRHVCCLHHQSLLPSPASACLILPLVCGLFPLSNNAPHHPSGIKDQRLH
jgi:hypothetical protein